MNNIMEKDTLIKLLQQEFKKGNFFRKSTDYEKSSKYYTYNDCIFNNIILDDSIMFKTITNRTLNDFEFNNNMDIKFIKFRPTYINPIIDELNIIANKTINIDAINIKCEFKFEIKIPHKTKKRFFKKDTKLYDLSNKENYELFIITELLKNYDNDEIEIRESYINNDILNMIICVPLYKITIGDVYDIYLTNSEFVDILNKGKEIKENMRKQDELDHKNKMIKIIDDVIKTL